MQAQKIIISISIEAGNQWLASALCLGETKDARGVFPDRRSFGLHNPFESEYQCADYDCPDDRSSDWLTELRLATILGPL